MKTPIVALVTIAALTISGVATAALGGAPNVDVKSLEKHWNGKPGAQVTQYAGVLLHWKADACGKLNGEEFDVTKCEVKTEEK